MPPIKSPADIAKKWIRVAGTRAPDYEAGVKAPRKDWASATLDATSSWKAATQAAIARGSWEAGVTRSGTPAWQRGALTKGVARWAPGIATAQEAYQRGFTPYAEAILNTTLPPRGPKGDPGNIERVRILAEALHATKLALSGP